MPKNFCLPSIFLLSSLRFSSLHFHSFLHSFLLSYFFNHSVTLNLLE
uniref:Uncharacterized protein n=1 Tax=Nelumbo nucifera TaxID=4432 RepID=A0A822YPK4_NELNU|nr:TPA_asm: hypothetical protein HUJ06_005160 [Nelumbo nucifera]